MHAIVERTVNLYDGDPVAGSPRGSQRVGIETFVCFRDNKSITKRRGGREVQQYRNNEAGRTVLQGFRVRLSTVKIQ